ncbi:TSUP family transporter, partial [Myxococcus llanfairpwllgwyngyllgogerychwyrndrobwllllantysiliogogogochensis]
MTPFLFTFVVLGFSVGAGLLGSLLGIGGGLILIPVLTLLLKVDIHYAVGASIVSVIATSSGAAAAYVRERMANMRVAMFLELATTAGALTGAFLSGRVG